MEPKRITKIIFIIILIGVSSCYDKTEQAEINFTEKFKEEIESIISSNDSIIDIQNLTSFEWDTLFVFKPYTPIQEIQSKMGFEWPVAESTLINQSDEFNLLVFIKTKEVVAFSKVPRNYDDFSKLASNGPFEKKTSRFKVKKEFVGDQPWIFIY